MNLINRSLVAFGFLACAFNSYGANSQPNIVLIMADDIGRGDISFYHKERTGGDSVVVPTPNIDSLIESGMRFSDAHSPAALCAPTRFSMMTGNYPFRNAKPNGVWAVHADPLIDPVNTTIARIAQKGGYHTAFFGKWGLGGNWLKKPKGAEGYSTLTHGALSFGFDYSLELPTGIQKPPYALYENREFYKLKEDSVMAHVSIEQTRYNLVLDAKAKNRDGYGDSNWDPAVIGPKLAEKAADFIKKHTHENTDKPFFMYYCSQAVHTPHVAADELDGVKIAGTTPGVLGDFIYELDAQVGLILKTLRETGVYDNTLIVFTSDNGGLPCRWDQAICDAGHRSNGNLAGQKGSISEGGHRIPFVAVWANQISPKSECHEPIVGHDMVATVAAITGQQGDYDSVLDSVNLLPHFAGKSSEEERYMIHQSGGITKFAIRDGKWKLVIDGNVLNLPRHNLYTYDAANFKPTALFDLEDNLEELGSKNLLDNPEHSSRAQAMFEKFCELRAKGTPTVWAKQ